MPFTLNGVGTSYFGRSNVSGHNGVCEKCGKSTHLSSYDTTSYFVVLFMPLIPLGKKRIINYCGKCTQHLVMPLKKWQKAKDEAFVETLEALVKNPLDSNAAKQALIERLGFDDKAEFMDLASQLEDKFIEDAEVMYVIGSGYYNYGDYEIAGKCIRKSLAVKDDEEVRQLMGNILIKQMRPGEAEEYFSHIITNKQKDNAGALVYLAMGFQAVGEHQKAIDLLGEAVSLEPEFQKNKEYKRILKKSEKNLHSNKPIVDEEVSKPSVKISESKSLTAVVGPYVGPVAAVIALLIYLTVCFVKGAGTEVYFVNGLSKSYDITAKGENYKLMPGSWRKAQVGDGKLKVAMAGDWPEIAEKEYLIKTNFFARPFVKKTFVINPDKSAMLVWSKTYYAAAGSSAPDGEEKIYVCKDFYDFGKVDYPFKSFPDSLESSSDNKSISKTRVGFFENIGLPVKVNAIDFEYGKAKAAEFLQNNLVSEPNKTEYLNLLYGMLEREEFIEVVQDGLEKRPILIDWHRFYQSAMEIVNPDHDLASEYIKLLDIEEDKNAVNYLIGRVVENRAESENYFFKSTEGENPCAYGYGALGYNRLSRGIYDEAVEFYGKAVALEGWNQDFMVRYFGSLKAAGKYDEALKICRRFLADEPLNFGWASHEWELMASKGDYGNAKRQAERWVIKAGKFYSEEWLENMKKILPAMFAYNRGDVKEYLFQGKMITENPDEDFTLALIGGKEITDKMLSNEEVDAYTYVVLYIAEKKAGRDSKAAEYLSKAIAEFSKSGDKEEKMFAGYLGGSEDPGVEKANDCLILPETKRILMTAMGYKYPEGRGEYFEMAKRLNYTKRYPYLFLKTVIE